MTPCGWRRLVLATLLVSVGAAKLIAPDPHAIIIPFVTRGIGTAEILAALLVLRGYGLVWVCCALVCLAAVGLFVAILVTEPCGCMGALAKGRVAHAGISAALGFLSSSIWIEIRMISKREFIVHRSSFIA
jgi:hypothetical protein